MTKPKPTRVLIEIEYGSSFQKEVIDGVLNTLLSALEQHTMTASLANKIKITKDYGSK